MTIRDFVAKHGITATVARGEPLPNWGGPHFAYRVTLYMPGDQRRRYTLPFATGTGWTREPTAADVLECLRSDASSVDSARDFEDWARDLGYDTDSRKAESTYRACLKVAARLRRFLGADAYAELMTAEEA